MIEFNPDRRNIKYAIKEVPRDLECSFQWLVEGLTESSGDDCAGVIEAIAPRGVAWVTPTRTPVN